MFRHSGDFVCGDVVFGYSCLYFFFHYMALLTSNDYVFNIQPFFQVEYFGYHLQCIHCLTRMHWLYEARRTEEEQKTRIQNTFHFQLLF